MSNLIISMFSLILILTTVYSSFVAEEEGEKIAGIDPPELSDDISPHDQWINHISNMSGEVANHANKTEEFIENYQSQLAIQEIIDFVFSLLPFLLLFALIVPVIMVIGEASINLFYKKQVQKSLVEARRLSGIEELYPHISDENSLPLRSYIHYLDNDKDLQCMRQKKQKLTYLIFLVKQDYGIKV